MRATACWGQYQRQVCGLAGFWSLVLCRMAVGVGEASFVSLAAPFIGAACSVQNSPITRQACGAVMADVAQRMPAEAFGARRLCMPRACEPQKRWVAVKSHACSFHPPHSKLTVGPTLLQMTTRQRGPRRAGWPPSTCASRSGTRWGTYLAAWWPARSAGAPRSCWRPRPCCPSWPSAPSRPRWTCAVRAPPLLA